VKRTLIKIGLMIGVAAGLAYFLGEALARAATVEEEAAAQVRAALPAELALVSLTVTGGDRPAAADLAVVWHGAPRPGPGTVQVTAGSEKSWARIVLARLAEVVVAKRALAAKEPIRPGDLVRESRPSMPGHDLTLDPSYLDGATVARPIAAGATLAAGDLILPPPVARGTAVQIVIAAGAARVTARGTLERPARVGERTSARLDGIPRLVEGELVDPATILISRGTR
jgi:flagella basal body P-ring formation protein FlgA